MPTELKSYSQYVRKTSTEPPLALSSKGASHTLNDTIPPPPFPQTSPGSITPSRITTSGISRSPQIRFAIACSSHTTH